MRSKGFQLARVFARCALALTAALVAPVLEPRGGSAIFGGSLSEALTLLASFDGVASPPGAWHMDDNIAVGPSSVLLIANYALTLRNKSGTLIASTSNTDFFRTVRTPDEWVGDPRLLFDPGSQRFFYVADGSVKSNQPCTPGACIAHHLLAVSKTSTPASLGSGDWYFYALDRTIYRTPAGVMQTANWGDGDIIAVSAETVVIKWHAYAFGPQNPDGSHGRGAKLRILDKARLIRGEPVTSWTDLELSDPDSGAPYRGPVAPAVGSAGDGPIFLLGNRGCDFIVWAIESLVSAPKLTHRSVPFSPCVSWASAGAVQPEGAPPILVVNGHNNVVLSGGSLWYAHSLTRDLGAGPVEALRWVQIDVTDWPNSASIVQDGVFGEANAWSFAPAIQADSSGNVAIVFARSSASEYPSLYFTGRLATDPPHALRPAVLLKAGTAIWVSIDTTSANVGRNRYID